MLAAMWWSLLRGSQWSEFADFVTPALFEVLAPVEVAMELKGITQAFWKRECFSRTLASVASGLEGHGLGIRIGRTRQGGFTRDVHGSLVLRLYFHQLFNESSALLDLRRSSFRADSQGALTWDPARLCASWEPRFLEGLRQLYRGYYTGDDRQYSEGLGALELQSVGQVFAEHFGSSRSGSPTRFSLAALRRTFHAIFVRCRDSRTHLHPDFVALGVYLACLYEHLEELGGEYDAREAFLAVVS